MMRLIDTGIGSAEENMALDANLLETLDSAGAPVLHLYRWANPSATFGYFIDPANHLNLVQAERRRLSLARRPTGGGIVFHIWDLAFSFLMPSGHRAFSLNTLDNYKFVNQVVLEVIKELFALKGPIEMIPVSAPSRGPDCQNFCMAKPTQYDVVFEGMKIAGAAQRKRKQGYLHQGTISLALPHADLLEDVLRHKEDVLSAIQSYTFAPLGRIWEAAALESTRAEIERRLAQKFMAILSD